MGTSSNGKWSRRRLRIEQFRIIIRQCQITQPTLLMTGDFPNKSTRLSDLPAREWAILNPDDRQANDGDEHEGSERDLDPGTVAMAP